MSARSRSTIVRVRQAFASAVDWTRIVDLASTGSLSPATSMVPPGIPGRSSTDYLPAYAPAAAQAELWPPPAIPAAPASRP